MALPSLTETEAHTEAEGGHGPELLGLGAEGWVYASITIFFLVAIFVFKVHRTIAAGLDARIAETRKSLDEAEQIRKEAEALLADAKEQHAASAADAKAMLDHAKTESEQLVEQAKADTDAMIERRKAMAEAKIANAERAAADGLRREAAGAAIAAARGLIAETHGEKADRELADKVIADI